MYRDLVKQASHEQLKEFVIDAMGMLKGTNYDTFETLELHLYKEINGCHFNEWMLKKALADIENEDGTKGGHWSVDETDGVARNYNVNLKNYNSYDWNYVMNMIYSDYYGSVPNELSSYVKLANKFINDKDAHDGKPLRYYLAFKE